MRNRQFKIHRDYYEEGVKLYNTDAFIFNPGLTVLAGCNGSGKTTLIRAMKSDLNKRGIPYVSFDNLKDGGNTARQSALLNDDLHFLATSVCSSEGENIVMNMNHAARKIGSHMRSENKTDECWIFLDAIDSGLSIDNIDDVKRHLFDVILESKQCDDIYIIVSTNSFELARGEQCMDVWSGKYIRFNNYDEYRQFIFESRKHKDGRYSN